MKERAGLLMREEKEALENTKKIIGSIKESRGKSLKSGLKEIVESLNKQDLEKRNGRKNKLFGIGNMRKAEKPT